MGQPKALLAFGKARLIDHVAARIRPQVGLLLVNANDIAITVGDAPVFADHITGFKGPLAGIHASLKEARNRMPDASHGLIVPVDCPFLADDLVIRLSSAVQAKDSVIVASSRGKTHPVIGLWPVSLVERLEFWLTSAKPLSVGGFLKDCTVVDVPFEDLSTPSEPLDPFFNINTPDDLALAIEKSHELSTDF